MSEFYTQNGWAGKNYDINLSSKEIAQKVRESIKKDSDLSQCKFSIRKSDFAGGTAIDVLLLEAPKQVFKDENQTDCQGIYEEELTPYGYRIMKKVEGYLESYNMSDCDGQIDYFHVKFYSSYGIGDYNKPFKVVEKKSAGKAKKIERTKSITAKANGIELVDYSEKAVAVIGDTKPIKDILKNLGGRFNFRLTCGAGWIFSKTKLPEIKTALGLN